MYDGLSLTDEWKLIGVHVRPRCAPVIWYGRVLREWSCDLERRSDRSDLAAGLGAAPAFGASGGGTESKRVERAHRTIKRIPLQAGIRAYHRAKSFSRDPGSAGARAAELPAAGKYPGARRGDRKSTRLNSS